MNLTKLIPSINNIEAAMDSMRKFNALQYYKQFGTEINKYMQFKVFFNGQIPIMAEDLLKLVNSNILETEHVVYRRIMANKNYPFNHGIGETFKEDGFLSTYVKKNPFMEKVISSKMKGTPIDLIITCPPGTRGIEIPPGILNPEQIDEQVAELLLPPSWLKTTNLENLNGIPTYYIDLLLNK